METDTTDHELYPPGFSGSMPEFNQMLNRMPDKFRINIRPRHSGEHIQESSYHKRTEKDQQYPIQYLKHALCQFMQFSIIRFCR